MNRWLIIGIAVVIVMTIFFLVKNPEPIILINEPGNTTNINDSAAQQPDTASLGESTASLETHSIEIKGYAYTPTTLTIKAGDTVTWTNKDSVRHTVTSDSGAELASKYLSTNENYTHIFTQPGTYKYHCKPHPNMKATIVVN